MKDILIVMCGLIIILDLVFIWCYIKTVKDEIDKK